jgi:hypothetical protein
MAARTNLVRVLDTGEPFACRLCGGIARPRKDGSEGVRFVRRHSASPRVFVLAAVVQQQRELEG